MGSEVKAIEGGTRELCGWRCHRCQSEMNMEAAVENITTWQLRQIEASAMVRRVEGTTYAKGGKAGALGESGE